MKLALTLCLIVPAASWHMVGRPAMRPRTSLDATGVFYSTMTGNTETCGNHIVEALKGAGVDASDLTDIGDADSVDSFDSLIVGAPTWHTGADSERSGTAWDEWLYDTLPSLDLSGKKVAVFGCGDQEGYADNYCDAAGELFDQFKAAGATLVGMTSTDGYNHVESKAEVESGKFCGQMFDEDNQYDESEGRAKAWVEQLKGEGMF
ncbi:hypothetical protein TL16_g06724 [Triparma laevis f. inornata]|uniref:Flavodoxin-like domain-containing protein n=2 Tax=Triparma laevis TaxID=1534972 RepID=A0A9W7EID8_9STRA|nr:hypothetical protein TL16_g06724 [Triparma laevis f. inornata]GMH79802.1 hypothetical protein TrLO_g13485 [Triparma laevis f. longispina]